MRLLSALPTWLLATAPLLAQANPVQINEVNFTTGGNSDQWIEIANFSTQPFDLSDWSIYQATGTPGRANNYWWAFPTGTTVPAANGVDPGFLRVFWLRPVSAPVAPNEINTGDSPLHFLFGLFAEDLPIGAGALALVDSQSNIDMNTASHYVDFVSWGQTTAAFPREDLAVQNGRWLAGQRATAPGLDHSLAFISFDLVEPSTPAMFFSDSTPSPNAFNHRGEQVTAYGSSCVLGGINVQSPQLTARSIPASGNDDFRLVVSETVPNQTTIALVFGALAPNGVPWFVPPCRVWIDVALPFVAVPVAAPTDPYVYAPPTPPNFGNSGPVAMQALVFRPDALGFTNGMVIQFGMQAP